jgi:hypothetical protein
MARSFTLRQLVREYQATDDMDKLCFALGGAHKGSVKVAIQDAFNTGMLPAVKRMKNSEGRTKAKWHDFIRPIGERGIIVTHGQIKTQGFEDCWLKGGDVHVEITAKKITITKQ